jgi:hypothetical protein
MLAKSTRDARWAEFDEEVPKFARKHHERPWLLTCTCSITLILARAAFCFALFLLVFAGVVAATRQVGAALSAAVDASLGSFLEQLAALLSFWTSVATLAGESLWLLLTGQSALCLVRILELLRMLDLY